MTGGRGDMVAFIELLLTIIKEISKFPPWEGMAEFPESLGRKQFLQFKGGVGCYLKLKKKKSWIGFPGRQATMRNPPSVVLRGPSPPSRRNFIWRAARI